MDYEMLGKRIRDERLLLRLTIEQLAEMVNKSTNYIGQIERNDGKPSLETVVDILLMVQFIVKKIRITNRITWKVRKMCTMHSLLWIICT